VAPVAGPDRGDRRDRPRDRDADRSDRPDRSERPDRAERPARSDRAAPPRSSMPMSEFEDDVPPASVPPVRTDDVGQLESIDSLLGEDTRAPGRRDRRRPPRRE
jgi:hypothetical protein